MGSEEVTLAAAEHACSAPKPKWSAKVRIPLVAQTLPEGVVGELTEGFHVRPEQGSGPKWEKTLLILVASLAESSIETVPSWLLTEPFDERPARRNHPNCIPTCVFI